MKKFIWIIEGLFWCTLKGAAAVLLRLPKSHRSWMNHNFGWQSRIIDPDGADVWAEQKTMPRGGRSHHRTDLIVEWARMKPQRAVKLFSFLALVALMAGLAIGYAAF